MNTWSNISLKKKRQSHGWKLSATANTFQPTGFAVGWIQLLRMIWVAASETFMESMGRSFCGRKCEYCLQDGKVRSCGIHVLYWQPGNGKFTPVVRPSRVNTWIIYLDDRCRPHARHSEFMLVGQEGTETGHSMTGIWSATSAELGRSRDISQEF